VGREAAKRQGGAFYSSKQDPSPNLRFVPPHKGEGRDLELIHHHTHIGQLPERVADIHAISHDKIIRAFEALEIGFVDQQRLLKFD
jgi:hypothetical protein